MKDSKSQIVDAIGNIAKQVHTTRDDTLKIVHTAEGEKLINDISNMLNEIGNQERNFEGEFFEIIHEFEQKAKQTK